IRQGEIEKAKAEAEHQARLQALAAQQAHEQQLAALKGDQTKKRLKITIGLVSAALVAGIGVTGFLMKKSADEQQKREQAFVAEQQRREQELKALKAEFEAAQKKQE